MKKKSKPSFWFENALENAFHNIKVDPLGLKDPQKWFSTKSISIKISKKDNEFILHAELPGFSKDEVRVKITPNYVDISAEKKKTSIEKKEGFYREERGFTSARRVFSMPEDVKADDIKAKFENGLLEIILPKKETARKEKEREIKVE